MSPKPCNLGRRSAFQCTFSQRHDLKFDRLRQGFYHAIHLLKKASSIFSRCRHQPFWPIVPHRCWRFNHGNSIRRRITQIPGNSVKPFLGLTLYTSNNSPIGIFDLDPYFWWVFHSFFLQGFPTRESNIAFISLFLGGSHLLFCFQIILRKMERRRDGSQYRETMQTISGVPSNANHVFEYFRSIDHLLVKHMFSCTEGTILSRDILLS